eukprot:8094516-Alexandrium_andersonii.AAC.1
MVLRVRSRSADSACVRMCACVFVSVARVQADMRVAAHFGAPVCGLSRIAGLKGLERSVDRTVGTLPHQDP